MIAPNCIINTGEIEKGTVFEGCSDEGCAWYGQDDKNNKCTLAFDIKEKIIEISHLNDVSACEFGANVSATGKYKKKYCSRLIKEEGNTQAFLRKRKQIRSK